jgi:spore coat protein CotH
MNRITTPLWICISLAMLWGCSESDEGDDDDSADLIGDDDDDSDALDAFFSLARIHDIAISVSDEGIEELLLDPREYTRGDVTIDGAKYPDIGVRLKGAAGSFVPLDGDYPEVSQDGNGNPGKSSFIIDFNRHVDGQEYLGLEKLTINNLVQDPSGMHEYLAYALFREGGVPGCRVGFASVSLNDEVKGIYALLESNDNDVFLERWFGSNEGNLYEGEYGTDFREGMTEHFDQDHGDDESRADVEEFTAALGEVEDGAEAQVVLEEYLDLELYATFAATEIYLGHWDGYVQSANNYKIFHPEDGRWVFVPWGIDQTFVGAMGEYAGVMNEPGPGWHGGGRVHEVCFMSDECVATLHDAFEDVLDRVDEMDLASMAEQVRDLVEDTILAEAEAHGDPGLTEESIQGVFEHIEGQRDQIEEWLDCLDGGSVDFDGDGANGCTADCDDHNPDVHPGAEEHCNFLDDDCNGVLDDGEDCPACMDVEGPDGHEYALCLEWLPWQEARVYCQDRGQDLASIHDGETWEHLTWTFMEIGGVWDSWIGLHDAGEDGSFQWCDGSEMDFEWWGGEGPYLEPEMYCGLNSPEGWWTHPCDDDLAVICKSP